MGQYYKIVNLTKKQYFKPLGVMKLTEFSCVGDRTLAFLHNLLKKDWRVDRVVVVSDSYRGKEGLEYCECQMYAVELDELYTEIKPSQFKFKLNNTFREQQKGWFVNKTKKEFIGLNILPKQLSNNIISPLALMIALGSDRSEYNGTNNFMVGYWALDEVYIDIKSNGFDFDEKGYTEVVPHFEIMEINYNANK